MYFESHAHYDDARFDCDREILLGEVLPKAGVSYVINSGSNMAASKIGIELAEKYDYIYAAVGVHPHEAESMTDKDLSTLEEYAKHPKVIAIGEIGLDYYYDHSPREIQVKRFLDQLEVANRTGLPVIIHSRDAAQETFGILKEAGIGKACGGVIHCYSGSAEMAAEYVKMGFYIGIGGVVTFKNARNICEVVEKIPLDKLLLETDCPYLSPEPNRGGRNDSQNLSYICRKIAKIKQVSIEETAKITLENGLRLFINNYVNK